MNGFKLSTLSWKERMMFKHLSLCSKRGICPTSNKYRSARGSDEGELHLANDSSNADNSSFVGINFSICSIMSLGRRPFSSIARIVVLISRCDIFNLLNIMLRFWLRLNSITDGAVSAALAIRLCNVPGSPGSLVDANVVQICCRFN